MTLIERAARALVVELARQDLDEITPEQVGFEGIGEGFSLSYIDQSSVDMGALVRAVLQAIRDPSEAMIAAAPEIDGIKLDSEAVLFWETMIDAALSE